MAELVLMGLAGYFLGAASMYHWNRKDVQEGRITFGNRIYKCDDATGS